MIKTYLILMIILLMYCIISTRIEAKPFFADSMQAVVIKVIDGDTVRVMVPAWQPPFQVWSIRLLGWDTPELHIACQKKQALAARKETRRLLPIGSTITINEVSFDKYGKRLDAKILTPDGRDLGYELAKNYLAQPYSGEGSRPKWCIKS